MKDWKEIEADSKEKYSLYLCSREWSERRRAVIQRAGGKCERCHFNAIHSVHHLKYDNKYNEPIEDLCGMCEGCHAFTHAHSDIDPASPQKLRRAIADKALAAISEYLWFDAAVAVEAFRLQQEIEMFIANHEMEF
jgi:hypothetical protein